jgi:glucose/arabinose dehydrogenase
MLVLLWPSNKQHTKPRIDSMRQLTLPIAATLLCLLPAAARAQADLRFELVASGFTAPLFLGAPAGDDRLFVVEKGGAIRIVENGVVRSTPFLNLSGLVNTSGEQGLLGLAFDPSYATNGRFYVNYISAGAQDTVVARYTVSSDRNIADPASAQTIITIDQPADRNNHKAGWIGFRPNEPQNLYIATGDGGSSNDPDNFAQNLNSDLGKILRLDVSGSGAGYTIPASNPFAGAIAGKDEIWAYGLRNPFRNSFDRATGDFYIADVGQNTREEINFEPAPGVGGRNYGWRPREGTVDNPGVSDPAPPGAVNPIFDYDRSKGTSITGGYVYRGSKIPEFQGTYLFGDFGAGTFTSFRNTNGTVTEVVDRTSQLDPNNAFFPTNTLASFGEDGAGELYAVSFRGSVYRLIPEPGSAVFLVTAGLALALRRPRRKS